MGNQKKSDWAAKIRKTYGLDLHIISREDIIISLMLPRNTSLCPRFLVFQSRSSLHRAMTAATEIVVVLERRAD